MNGPSFILFDHSGDRGRIMLEPDIFCEFPNVMPGAEQAGEFSQLYREAMATAFAALQSMRDSRPQSTTLCAFANDGFLQAGGDSDTSESLSKISWAGSNGKELNAGDEDAEEDLEDLEALLYSDDEECSTGHSPSDLTSEEEEESRLDTQEITSVLKMSDSRNNINMNDSEKIWNTNNNNRNNSDKDEDEALERASGRRLKKSRKAFSGHLSVLKKRERKDRIRQTVTILQSLVPGGELLHPAVVLDNAIHYMKSLQMKVLELEASRQAMI